MIKEERKKYMKEYREKNKERIKEKRKEWEKKHNRNEYKRIWREKNKEHCKEYQKYRSVEHIKQLEQENKDLKEEIKKLQRIVISKQEDYLIISVGKITKVFKLNDNKKWINEVGDNNE